MDRSEVLKIMSVLRGAYPAFYRSIDRKEAEATVGLWEDMFKHNEYPLVAAAVKALKAQGIRTVMLTGDSERTAAAIAAEVGVDEYPAEILPADKASFVEAERAKGHTVIMIGDGINDSPALSKANVGIAISDGAAIAREIADITIAADDLHELVSLRSMTNLLESS